MNRQALHQFLFCILFLSTLSSASAQNMPLKNEPVAGSKDSKAPEKKFPAAVFVKLRSESSRIKAATKDGRLAALAEIKKDALGVQTAMKRDFKENFHYCPVYYFMDTDADLIKNGKLDGVLMYEDGTPLKVAPKEDYVIADFGHLEPIYRPGRSEYDSMRATYNVEPPFGEGLMILNDQFQEITFFYKLYYDNIFFNMKKKNKQIQYVSKHFDIEYYPFVKLFNQKLTNRMARFEFINNYVRYRLDENKGN